MLKSSFQPTNEVSVPRNDTTSVPSGSSNVIAANWVWCSWLNCSSTAPTRIDENRGLRAIAENSVSVSFGSARPV